MLIPVLEYINLYCLILAGVAPNKDGRSPWLAFCDAIMSSVLALGVKPSDTMSLECVSCVLKENRLDLLSHWVAQDRYVEIRRFP